MMKKISRALFLGCLAIMLLAGCQSAAGATTLPGVQSSRQGGFNNGQFVPSSAQQTRIAGDPALATQIAQGGFPRANGTGGFGRSQATAAPTAEPQPTSTPQPTATQVSLTAGAEQTAQDYFNALQQGDFASAAKMVSAYSLMISKITAGDVVDTLTQQQSSGTTWSGFKLAGDSQVIDANTVLVHVSYQQGATDAKTGKPVQTPVDEWWPFRLEQKKWMYNWSNIIDFKTLSADVKLANGLTLQPLQLTRYTDKIRLTMLAQNGTNEAIVIGQASQVLATFHFGDKTVDSENTRYILDAYRSYTNVTIDIKGLYTTYPDAVEIVKFKTQPNKPWFTFGLVD